MSKLLPQQQQSKDKLSQMKVGAFFMEPGTGKTRPVYELAMLANPDLILWFTPFQTKDNLREELDKWGAENVRIEGIESLSNSDRLYLQLYKLLSVTPTTVLVVDESLKIKNHEAKRTKRLIELSKLTPYKYILNGTPLSRNLLDLWSQFEFLSPKILNMGVAEFKNNFCEYKTMYIRKPGRSTRTKEWIVKYHNLDYLYKLIDPYIFEADLKLDVNKQYINIDFNLEKDTKEEHQHIIESIMEDYWKMAKPNFFLELTQKLQNNYSRSPEKFDIVRNIIKENDPSKILIFAKYIETQELLKEKFPNVTVLSYMKHSYGLNLQKYNRTIFFDKVWDYALREQTERRTYRTGQEEECIYYDLTGNVGLEKLIDDNIIKKADLLQEFKKLSLEEFKKKIK